MTLAAIPSAKVKTAVRAKPGEPRIWRKANRKSCSRLVMVGLCVTIWLLGIRQFESQSILGASLMTTKRLAASRWCLGTELGVRFHRRVSVNEQGQGRP